MAPPSYFLVPPRAVTANRWALGGGFLDGAWQVRDCVTEPSWCSRVCLYCRDMLVCAERHPQPPSTDLHVNATRLSPLHASLHLPRNAPHIRPRKPGQVLLEKLVPHVQCRGSMCARAKLCISHPPPPPRPFRLVLLLFPSFHQKQTKVCGAANGRREAQILEIRSKKAAREGNIGLLLLDNHETSVLLMRGVRRCFFFFVSYCFASTSRTEQEARQTRCCPTFIVIYVCAYS